jgi:hypothetical protein
MAREIRTGFVLAPALVLAVAAAFAAGLGVATPSSAERFAYVDEAAYLADLEVLGLAAVLESFEDDAAWGAVRSSIVNGWMTAPDVTHLGVRWSANNPVGEVTTGSGPARSGAWGFYTLPHGSYLTGIDCHLPGNCGDGWVGVAAVPILGIGGWIHGIYGSKVELVLDGDLAAPVDFGEICDATGENCSDLAQLGTGDAFFGVIDTEGFTEFEFRELEGTLEDAKYLWADDFTIGFALAACNDGIDNDADGLIDFDGAGVGGPDPQCLNAPWRGRENPVRCGIGFELALLLPLVRWLRRSRRV